MPDDRRATAIGGVLVVAAVLIGLLLLGKGFGDDHPVLSAGTGSATTSTVGAAANEDATTTTVAPVDPATVKVFVANASGTKSGARKVADALIAKGFPAPGVGDAPAATATAVYYSQGSAAQAQAVADRLGLDPGVVAVLPQPSPVADLKGATVLVLIGKDGALTSLTGDGGGSGTTTTTKQGSTSTTAPSGTSTTTAAKTTTTTKA